MLAGLAAAAGEEDAHDPDPITDALCDSGSSASGSMLGDTRDDARRGPAEEGPMTDYAVRALAPDTWEAYAAMVERHNGVFGGCWCTWFHTMNAEKERTYEANRALKCAWSTRAVPTRRSCFDGDEAVAWASTDRPRNCRTSITASSTRRSSMSFPTTGSRASSSTRRYRRQGLSAVALQGALDLIAALRRRRRRGIPARQRRQEEVGPLRRDPDAVRASGLRVRPQPRAHGNCVMRRTVP